MLVQKRRAAYMVHAPAKLNLFFEVRQRRHDGFHEIETLMIPVSLYDTLYLRSTPTKRLRTEFGKAEPEMAESETPAAVRFSCRDLSGGALQSGDEALNDPHRRIPSDATNLAVRAVELLKQRAGVEAGAEVQLIKRIPAAAGLGGGSSDAAAALLAANAAWRVGWTRTRLMELAAELGSDVPFFLGEGAAICRGRGELVESCRGLGDWHSVVVVPPIGLSTAEVYANVEVSSTPRCVDSYVRELRSRTCRSDVRAYNALEGAADRLTPWIGRLRNEFEQAGCCNHAMSGSGSSYFGIYQHAREARRAARVLEARGLGGVFVVRNAT